ncbi:MAG: hypothetical protein EOO69_13660 [Moraxellaceae bacterium]|nr:MAG: hypothetical protein EOO69_13660 [Moraxellaceae bacterium]
MLRVGVALPLALLLASGVSGAASGQQHKKDPAVIEQLIAAKGIYPVINGKAFKNLNSLAMVHQQLGKPTKVLSQGYDECNGQEFPQLLDYGSFQVNERTLKVQTLYFNKGL